MLFENKKPAMFLGNILRKPFLEECGSFRNLRDFIRQFSVCIILKK